MFDYAEVRPIYGPPGTGKTTTCVAIVSDLLEKGVDPHSIAYVAFTNKAADEAAKRVSEKLGIPISRMPYFRTIHSLGNRAYKAEFPDSRQVMKASDFEEVGDRVGMPVRAHWKITEDADFIGGGGVQYGEGDLAMSQINLARARAIPLIEQLHTYANPHDFIRFNCQPDDVLRFQTALSSYKEVEGKYDFNDMLDRTKACAPLPVKYAIIDEAQDLSAAQWQVCHWLMRNCEQIWVAGDDDQAIYRFSGADSTRFLQMGDLPTSRVLEKTWRLPKAIYDYSARIIHQVGERVPKEWHTEKEGGSVQSMELDDLPVGEGEWLLLARNRSHMRLYEEVLRTRGYSYRLDGRSSIPHAFTIAVKAWETVRKGKPITADAAHHMYANMQSGKALKHGVKGSVRSTLKQLGKDRFDWDDLPGLLVNREQAWYDALESKGPDAIAYFRQVARHGELLDEPRISLNTIHGVKGGESENVAILPAMGKMTWDGFIEGGAVDDEHRCAYVAATRAKQNLYLILHPTEFQYPYHELL